MTPLLFLLLGAVAVNSHGGLGVHPRYAATPSVPGMQPPPEPTPSSGNSSGGGGGGGGGVFFYAKDFGAKGDNATDNTAPVTAALKAAYTANGGTVQLSQGIFKFAGSLVVPPGVTLAGTYSVVPSHDLRPGGDQSLHDGTVLVPTAGRGVECDINCTEAFITVVQNGAVRGFVILYDEQERVNTPVSYPWAIFLGDPKKLYNKGGNANNAAAFDIELLGAWNGIAAVQAHRHYIARIQGQPVNIGVFLDATYDIGRIEDVHFNPWFSMAKPFIYYQTTFGRAFVMGRSDWEYVFNTFAFAYAIGYHFIERATGSMNGNFLGIGADAMVNASVQVDQSQAYGILITNGEFTAFCDAPAYGFCAPHSDHEPVHVRVGPKNVGAVKFATSSFWGPAAAVAVADGTGVVTFTQCHFDAWDSHLTANGTRYTNGTPAITQVGSTSVIVTGSEFVSNHGPKTTQLGLDPAGKGGKVIFTENIIKGVLKVDNNGNNKKVIIANNLDDS